MSYQVDPMQIIMAIRNGENPQQLMISILEGNMKDTPMGENLINLIRNGKQHNIEAIARNYCAQNGVDFDKEFNAFKQKIGL